MAAIVCLAVCNDDGHLKNSDCWNLCLRASACAQVPVVVKVPMVPYQSTLYKWVKATGTKRLEPESMRPGSSRTYATLSNKCMELRKVTTPPLTSPLLNIDRFVTSVSAVRGAMKAPVCTSMAVNIARQSSAKDFA